MKVGKFVAFAAVACFLGFGSVAWADPVVATFRAVVTDNPPNGATAEHFGIPIGAPIRGTVMFDPDRVQQSASSNQGPFGLPEVTINTFVYFDSQGGLHPGGRIAINVGGQTFDLPIISITTNNWETGASRVEEGYVSQDMLAIEFGTRLFSSGAGLCGVFNGEVMTSCGGALVLWYPTSTLGNSLPDTLVIPLTTAPYPGLQEIAHLSYVSINWSGPTQSAGVSGWLDGNDDETGNVPPHFGGVDPDAPIIPDDCVGTLCSPPWNMPPVVVPTFPGIPPDCLFNAGGRISLITCPSPPSPITWMPMDPPIAVGYDYQLSADSPKIIAFELPVLGDNMYRLHLFDGSTDLIVQGGVQYLLPEGVDHFQILDIEESIGLDSENPRAFVTNMAFASAGVVSLTMTPLTQESVMSVTIMIKPGSDLAPINPTSNGDAAVAILTTTSFDASTVDPPATHFGHSGTEATAVKYGTEDVNADGKLDLVVHFKTSATGVVCGDTTAKLTGKTKSGQSIVGSGAIKTVGCK